MAQNIKESWFQKQMNLGHLLTILTMIAWTLLFLRQNELKAVDDRQVLKNTQAQLTAVQEALSKRQDIVDDNQRALILELKNIAAQVAAVGFNQAQAAELLDRHLKQRPVKP